MHRVNVPVRPSPFSFFSRLALPDQLTVMDIKAQLLKDLVTDRAEGVQEEDVFDEAPPTVDLSFFPHRLPSNPRDLSPDVPIFVIPKGYDFASGKLESFCRRHPISIIRGIPEACGLDLSLFSMDTLAALHPQMTLKVLTQLKQEKDENRDEDGRDTWELTSEGGSGTLKTQVEYLKKEEKKVSKKGKKDEIVKFGIGNLSDHPAHFTRQIQELDKLPPIFRYGQADDLLRLTGIDVDGLTGIYTFLKTAGVRTPAHEEDGGIPSVNISIGPGCSEWIAIELGHIKQLEEACEKKGLVYGHGSSLWPNMSELQAANVPVFRFSQQPGDLVYTGPGTLHWVQGEGVGSNIAWNSGALSTQVLKHSKWQIGRDRLQKVQSSIPLIRTAWLIAERGGVTDENIVFDIRGILFRSLAYLLMVERFLEDCSIAVVDMGAHEMEEMFNCEMCKCEIFNVVFVNAQDDFCFECAQANGGIQMHSPRRQRSTDALSVIYDAFTH